MSAPVAAATAGPSAYWYLTRSTGAVALVLLTLSAALGVLDVSRWSSPRFPRFAIDSLHRSSSLLVMVFVVLHVITAVLDSFAPIRLLDAVIPFTGTYRPLWLGLGALAFDLLLALAATSLVRRHLGHRAWRAVHWSAYACWPLALVHTLGTGSDVKSAWLLALSIACLAVVIVAVAARAMRGWAEHARLSGAALAADAVLVLGLVLWLPGGPLGPGWARRAGTPASLLGKPSSAPRSNAAAGRRAATARAPRPRRA
jgi:methionine sulfoxide reductase heme-binding subunit